MGMIQEFKSFAMRGNVVDLAVGVVIGGAFGKIVGSLVSDVMMPVIGRLTGGVDFSDLFINLSPGTYASLAAAKEAGAATLNYGVFLNAIVQFAIVAFALFLVIRAMNKLQKPAPAPPPSTEKCGECLMDVPIGAKRCGHCTAVRKAA